MSRSVPTQKPWMRSWRTLGSGLSVEVCSPVQLLRYHLQLQDLVGFLVNFEKRRNMRKQRSFRKPQFFVWIQCSLLVISKLWLWLSADH